MNQPMPPTHPDYVRSAEEQYDLDFPPGSLIRQEEDRRREEAEAKAEVPESQWRGNGA